ncbi:MAG: cyclodeaminase/cyclohydrolase family protein [Gemmatimonadetes bacterium]|nr:cyclodeaminase/cyclohydrolase family protein [Gemmatimonadota bacterium]
MNPDQRLADVLGAIADGTPAPGGGAAAAVAGALAAALAGMCGRLALPRAAPEAHPGVESLIERADALRAQLAALAERDAEAYRQVLEAQRATDGTEGDRRLRRVAAWREAVRVPAGVIRACREVALLARRMARDGLPGVQGDALMAALLAAAAAAGSQVNLRLNLNAAGRPEDLRVLADESEILLRETQRAAADARLAVEERLGGGRGGATA